MSNQAPTAEFEGTAALPAIGDVIAGKYRVESVVGSGGMGVVLCATHVDLGQQVAIKVLTVADEDARRDEARERFLREGRATAALVSDHVVRVYDVGTLQSGAPFMVMELLRGHDLARTLVQTGPFGIELACDCVRQAAEAIACAHAQGIVHRDLKPSNLFLTQRSDGAALIKVLDFGISKNTSSQLEPVTGDLTATRSVLGTPFYMSPEQVRDAKKVDARTDVWSLGLILHELLSGSPAFEGTTLPGVCASIAADPPAALRLKRPEVPLEVEAIVLKCLEKDPARRFQSARELVQKLTPWTGRAESGLPSPLSDATIRSSSLGFELAALRDGSTVALPSSDTGTLASAVFTRSGERLAEGAAPRSQPDRTESPISASPTSTPTATPTLEPGAIRISKRATLGAAALLLSVLITWSLRGSREHEQPSGPPAAPSLPAAIAEPSATPASTFAVQIDSSPIDADVFEEGTLLGTTPMRISVDSSSVAKQPRRFTIRKAGYLPYTIVQGALTKDTRVLAELAQEPTSSKPEAPAAALKKPTGLKAPSAPPKPSSDIFMQR